MARQEGTLKLNSNIESRFNAPLDARSRVSLKSDLYTLPYAYRGLVVSVTSEDTVYLQIADDHTQESSWKALESGTGGGSGWGIAKVGTVTGTFDGNGWLQGATVDISGLGVASVDDYEVVLRGASAGSAQIIPYVDIKTTAMFRVGANKSTTGVSEFTVGYIIVAKGFGGGVNSSSWGIAKYGTVNITGMTSTAYRSAPVDLSDLTIASVDDYVILTQPSSADNISYNIESTWCRKESTTQAFVYAYSSSKDSCSVDYVVLAKGYGGGSGDTHHVELTQAEYDALTQEQKNDGTVYFVTDANPLGGQSSAGASLPNGGTRGQVLIKQSNTDGDAGWENLPSSPIGSISVNGSNVQPDSAGNVALSIPSVSIQGVKRNGTELTLDAENKVDIEVPTTLSDVMSNNNNIDRKRIHGSQEYVVNVADALVLRQNGTIVTEFSPTQIMAGMNNRFEIDSSDPSNVIHRTVIIQPKLWRQGFSVSCLRYNTHYTGESNTDYETDRLESAFSITYDDAGIQGVQVQMSEDVRQAFLNALGLAHLAQQP